MAVMRISHIGNARNPTTFINDNEARNELNGLWREAFSSQGSVMPLASFEAS